MSVALIEIKNKLKYNSTFKLTFENQTFDLNYLKSVDVLLLDDFGSENMTNWLRDDVLGPVLNYRLI